MSSQRSIERCFDEAEDTGVLQVSGKGLREFPLCVDNHDMADVIKADVSHNKFFELPQNILVFCMMESLNCSHNYLKTLPDLSNLDALSQVDISQNQLSSLPVHLCSLPLKILRVSHNKLTSVPSEIGLLNKMQHLDLACNELTTLPTTMGELSNLRLLNVRRNKLMELPDELSKLKNLVDLDISNNMIQTIPPALRLITSLIRFKLENNPLLSPPAHVCSKGRVHVFKFLNMAAQQQEKRWSVKENRTKGSPSSTSISSNSLVDCGRMNHVDDRHEVCEDVDISVEPKRQRIRSSSAISEDSARNHPYYPPTDAYYPPNEHLAAEQLKTPDRRKLSPNASSKSDSPLLEPTKPQTKPTLPRKPNSLHLKEQELLKQKSLKYDRYKSSPQTDRLSTISSNPSSPIRPSPTSQQPPQPHTGTMSLDRNNAKKYIPTQRTKSFKENNERIPEILSPGQSPEEKRLDELEARKQQLLKSKQVLLKSKQRLEEGLKTKATSPRDIPLPIEGQLTPTYTPTTPTTPKTPTTDDSLASPSDASLSETSMASHTINNMNNIAATNMNSNVTTVVNDVTSAASANNIDNENQQNSSQQPDGIFDHISKRNPMGKSSKRLMQDGASDFTMRRFFDTAKEEYIQLEKLREQIESRLGIKLPDDLPASLSDGIVLCHLINHLSKSTIQVIHVPSSGVPKLTMPKCQMNVDSFLESCIRMGVAKVNTCTAPDILEEKSPSKLCQTVNFLLAAVGQDPNRPLNQEPPRKGSPSAAVTSATTATPSSPL